VELKDFHIHERKFGPPLRLTRTMRVSIPMHAHLDIIAASQRSDASTVIRHALHEYFQRRGIDAFVAP